MFQNATITKKTSRSYWSQKSKISTTGHGVRIRENRWVFILLSLLILSFSSLDEIDDYATAEVVLKKKNVSNYINSPVKNDYEDNEGEDSE